MSNLHEFFLVLLGVGVFLEIFGIFSAGGGNFFMLDDGGSHPRCFVWGLGNFWASFSFGGEIGLIFGRFLRGSSRLGGGGGYADWVIIPPVHILAS